MVTSTKQTTDADIFDFGFTAVDESELEAVQKAAEVSTAAEAVEEKLRKLYEAIQPLLKNLKANPDKDYIYWPNRIEKVQAFETHIKKIVEG
jgi:hypothetical protein